MQTIWSWYRNKINKNIIIKLIFIQITFKALWVRFLPAMDKIREALDKKFYGDLKIFTINHFDNWIHLDRLKEPNGGGALLDTVIYPLELTCAVFNHERPIKIVCTPVMISSGNTFLLKTKFKKT